MLRIIKKATQDAKDAGASAVEYGLMVAAIAAVIVGLVFALGGIVSGAFQDTQDQICANQPAGADGAVADACAP